MYRLSKEGGGSLDRFLNPNDVTILMYGDWDNSLSWEIIVTLTEVNEGFADVGQIIVRIVSSRLV